MAFGALLCDQLLEGKTSHDENGVGVKLERVSDECVLVFKIDCDKFRTRRRLADGKVCDLLIFLKKKDDSPKIVLCELKGSDSKRAVEQIKSVFINLKPDILADAGHGVKYYGVVMLKNGSPPEEERKRSVRELSELGVRLIYRTGKKGVVDIRSDLD